MSQLGTILKNILIIAQVEALQLARSWQWGSPLLLSHCVIFGVRHKVWLG
jgi:hypothetical protein